MQGMLRLSRRQKRSWLAYRVYCALEFLQNRGSAQEFDDQLRALADNDALALDGSYSLTRFITWAIPILGFLGTVLGITEAISGVTPEVLEKSLSTVTDGLALAFDTTALGLALTMVTMFVSFLTERAEQNILEIVDQYAEQNVGHRFERPDISLSPTDDRFRSQIDGALKSIQQAVEKQAEPWARALAEVDRRQLDKEKNQENLFVKAVEIALQRTLDAFGKRLEEMEKAAVSSSGATIEKLAVHARAVCEAGREQQQALARIIQGIASQAQTMAQVHDGEKELLRLQQILNQNLTALTGAGTFEQAVHSLTAAIHLLTTRTGAVAQAGEIKRPGTRPGAAA
jgi:hypothetical protein